MKIGYVYPFRAFPVSGGNHLHAYQLIRHFLAAGHAVYTLGDGSVEGTEAFSRDDAGVRALVAAVDVLYIRIDANFIGDNACIRQLMAAPRPIVWEINSPANEALAFSWLGGDRRPTSGVGKLVDRARRHAHAWRQRPGIEREESLRRRFAERVNIATCVSAGNALYANRGLGIADARVVPNGGDPDADRPDGPVAALPEAFAGGLKVVYAGSPIYPWQGMDVVAATMRLCAQAGDPIYFVLLMNQAPPISMESVNALVRIAVPHREVSHYTRAADVGLFVYPDFFWSPWGSHGSPIKVFEYMACGLPVAASDVGQLRDIIAPGRTGALFANDPAAVRRCLLDLHAKRAQLPEMGVNARRMIETEFNWTTVASRTIDALQAAVERGPIAVPS